MSDHYTLRIAPHQRIDEQAAHVVSTLANEPHSAHLSRSLDNERRFDDVDDRRLDIFEK